MDDIVKDLLKYKSTVDNDDIRFKEIVKKKLIDNDRIIYALNNQDLIKAEAENADYFGVNILSYYMINPVQSNVQNFICYEVQFDEVARYNKIIKLGDIIFTILCEQKNIIEKNTGIARHDLLAALIMDEFHWSNCFGVQVHCVSDKASVVDTKYACRTLVFEGEFLNSIAKTTNGVTQVFNNHGINR